MASVIIKTLAKASQQETSFLQRKPFSVVLCSSFNEKCHPVLWNCRYCNIYRLFSRRRALGHFFFVFFCGFQRQLAAVTSMPSYRRADCTLETHKSEYHLTAGHWLLQWSWEETWNSTGGLSKSQTKKPEFVVAAYRSCGACPVAHLLLPYNRFITWLRVMSVSLPPGEQRAQSGEDLDADCTGLMKSKSLTLSQTLEALRCIIAADRESNRLRGRMRMWHRTYLSQKRKRKKERSSVRC